MTETSSEFSKQKIAIISRRSFLKKNQLPELQQGERAQPVSRYKCLNLNYILLNGLNLRTIFHARSNLAKSQLDPNWILVNAQSHEYEPNWNQFAKVRNLDKQFLEKKVNGHRKT